MSSYTSREFACAERMASHGRHSEIFRFYLKQQEEMRRLLKYQNRENLEQWRFNGTDTYRQLHRHEEEQRRLQQQRRENIGRSARHCVCDAGSVLRQFGMRGRLRPCCVARAVATLQRLRTNGESCRDRERKRGLVSPHAKEPEMNIRGLTR